MKHQASAPRTPLEDVCSQSGSLKADSEMQGRGYEICIRDQYLLQEEGVQITRRLNCHAHGIPTGGSSGAIATPPPCPELGPNSQAFVSSSLHYGT